MNIPISVMQLGLWALYGFAGQFARGLFGLYKLRQKQGKDWKVDKILFGLSLVSGAMIGILGGTIVAVFKPEWLNPAMLILLGFAGVDAIETFLKKKLKDIGLNTGA